MTGRLEALRQRLPAAVATARWPIVVVAALVVALCANTLFDRDRGTLNLPVDASLTGLLPGTGGGLETYERVRETFGGDDVLLVAWFADDVFTPGVLRAFKRLARDVRRLDAVRRVDSLASAIALRERGDGLAIEKLLRRVPRGADDLAALRRDAVDNPLYGGQLVAHDGRGLLMAVQFDGDASSASVQHAVTDIRAFSRQHAAGLEQFVSGPIYARLEISRILFRDIQRALPLAILVTALLAAIFLRSVRGVLLPLGATGIGLAATVAIFVARGHALNFVTAIMPPVVFVIGFAFAMHIVSEFDHAYRERTRRREAVTRALGAVLLPLALTAATTAIGFASLASSTIVAIRTFGLYAALGTLLCWLAAVALIPAALVILPARVRPPPSQGMLGRLAPRLAAFDLGHRRVIIVTATLITLAAVWSASRVEVSTDYLRNFAPTHPVRQHFERIRSAFSGAVPIQIVFRGDRPDSFVDPLNLRVLREFETWLEAQPEIGGATSLVDLTAMLNRGINGITDDIDPLPQTPAATGSLFFLSGGDELERFVDRRYQQTVMHVSTGAVASSDLRALTRRIERRLAELPAHISGEVTGSSALLARTLDDVVRGQLTSLAGAMLVIYGILVALFGSPRAAAIALLPNLMPIACFFGLLGVTGITLNLATSLVAAVALGIAVDDSMHLLTRFNEEARRAADEDTGVARALTTVIRPVTYTTIALGAGFLTLTGGELQYQAHFGLLAAATLAIAWIIDLTLTPALAGQLHFVTLWEVLTLDLGAAPETSIPFFRGLSRREARIAAVLGNLERIDAGEEIMHVGEQGNDMHIVIDGRAVAFLEHNADGEREILRELARGAMIGEVALFHGTRTASVEAVTDMRLLRLDNSALTRIQARYPRIAAKLYRNLGDIMADRLADVTGRL